MTAKARTGADKMQDSMFPLDSYTEERLGPKKEIRPYEPYMRADVKAAEEHKLFTVISTFAGGGGSSTGYRLAGGTVLLANEFIKPACETYSANYPSTVVLPHDIRLLNGGYILRKVGLKEGELDILDGSPPCATFSMYGSREAAWGKVKKYSEKKQRVDDLFFEFARILKEIQPKTFIAENVKGLTLGAAGKLLGSEQPDMLEPEEATIFKTLTDCGYKVKFRVLNAAYFDVPQSRERLFLIGVRNDLPYEASFPKPKNYVIPLKLAWDGIEQVEEQRLWLLERDKGKEVRRWLEMLPKDPPKPVGASDYHPKGSWFNLIRMSMHHPACTITQSGSDAAGASHPIEDRRLTIPELKRAFSLPDDFILTGTYGQQYERCGRMVPCKLMQAIAENLYKKVLVHV